MVYPDRSDLRNTISVQILSTIFSGCFQKQKPEDFMSKEMTHHETEAHRIVRTGTHSKNAR